MEVYFGTLVRQVDSSLMDEWERMRNPNWVSAEVKEGDSNKNESQNLGPLEQFPDPAKNKKAFQILLRNEIFRLIRALAARDFELALQILETSSTENPELPNLENQEAPWTADRLQKTLEEFNSTENRRIRTDTQARAPKHLHLESSQDQDKSSRFLKAQQILIDTAEFNDWVLELTVDLETSRKEGRLALRLDRMGPIV